MNVIYHNYRRPIVSMSLSEHVMTSDRGEGCQLMVETAMWHGVNKLCPKLDRDRVSDRVFTIFLFPYITLSFVLNMLRLYSLNVSLIYFYIKSSSFYYKHNLPESTMTL